MTDVNEQVITTAVSAIGEYSDALKELSTIERVGLRAELERKKQENFQKVSDACMKSYKKRYGELPSEDEYWRFMIADEYSTGNGRTLSVLLTQALPSCPEDFDEENKYTPITTQEYRAVREFHKYFGTYSLFGIEFVSREDFFEKYANLLPPALVNLKDKQCYLHYHGELHFNFA